MLKLFAKSILLLTLAVLLLKLIDSYCIQNELFHFTYNRAFNKKEKFDIVVMGNSLSQRTYNTTYIDSVLNTKSINIGGSAHHFFLTNAIFQKLINDENAHPNKLLVIEISPWQFKDYGTEKLKFLQMAGLDEIGYSKSYFQAVNNFFTVKEYPKALSSTIRFHDELTGKWVKTYQRLAHLKKINANGFELNVKHRIDEKTKNIKSDYLEIATQYSNNINNAKEIKLDEFSEKMVLSIIDDCREKGINLLFVTAPALNMLYNEDDYGRMKYIENLLRSNKAKHINCNRIFNDINLTPDDFSDLYHLNKFGNRKLAPVLLDTIISIFDIKKNIINPKINNEKEALKAPETKTVSSDNVIGWDRVRTTLGKLNVKYDLNQEVYRISRNTNTENSYINIANNDTDINENYSVSIIAKKGNIDNYLGMRISGNYPNRVDAVFNLEKGIVKGISKGGDFDNQEAKIEALNDGWYKCTLYGRVSKEGIIIILGPTDKSREISTWEGVTKDNNDILVVPNSLKFKKETF